MSNKVMRTVRELMDRQNEHSRRRNGTDKRKASNARAKDKAAPPSVKFMAWDGEGYDEGENKHIYALLANSNNQWWYESKGIATLDALYYLTETALQYPGYEHVIFSGSYDCNMLLKDLPRHNLERLHKTGRLYYKNYRIEYHPKKFLDIRRYPESVFIHGRRNRYEAKIVLWDVFGFFQSSFLKALDTFFSQDEKWVMEYEKIKEGKDRRGSFTQDEIESYVLPYCKLELSALVRLMDRLYNEYCLRASPRIKLRRFDGAGAIAHSILTSKKVRNHYPEEDALPHHVMLASQYAYGGGRIELLQYGHYEASPDREDTIFHVDICSAYPAENAKLCSLYSGEWVHTENCNMLQIDKSAGMSVYRVIWDYRDSPVQRFYPFFYRSYPGGTITYPIYGQNWVWGPELEAAIKWNDVLQGKLKILEKWDYYPQSNVKPYEFIYDMYEKRRQLKAAGHGMNVVYKLGYNSFYGKTVQHLGYEDHERKGEVDWRPPFFQLQYGGMITSGCRAKLFDAAMQAPNDIIMFATDGIYSTQALDLDIGTGLGQWEYESVKSATFVQSGVYWTTDTQGKTTPKYRGFDKDALTEEAVLESWRSGEQFLQVPSTRFVTMGQGLMLNDTSLWNTWHKSTRNLELSPLKASGKRVDYNTYMSKRDKVTYTPHKGLVPTFPNNFRVLKHKNGLPEISEPFPLPWSKERAEYDRQRANKMLQNEITESVEARYE